MRLNLYKRGLRVLAIAESFRRNGDRSILAGVVMRADCRIDGIGVDSATVGGLDATEGVLRIFYKLGRRDINLILLNGAVISWFNIIDIDRVYTLLGLPLISLTYEPSEGLERYIKEYFGDSEDYNERVSRYRSLGDRSEVMLKSGHRVWVRTAGITEKDAAVVLNRFTSHGRIPEPIKIAKLIARSILDLKQEWEEVTSTESLRRSASQMRS
ncbi:MAG TPA: DUF99 family protein [Candidatus Syntrophoarchaeum butanivorans]|uniref:UPF0215 protein ENI32_05750 n=1 Tax=Candidatus Syntropharchaeum butanivorans TaxID=1839936 RepID=A0A7J2S1M8_9EURY|nr:DUF99 family protein [Candidatus Syntrophoarchaeum butanivorans]